MNGYSQQNRVCRMIRENLPASYARAFVYQLGADVVHLLRDPDCLFAAQVAERVRVSVGDLARREGFKSFVAVPRYGKANEILLEGRV